MFQYVKLKYPLVEVFCLSNSMKCLLFLSQKKSCVKMMLFLLNQYVNKETKKVSSPVGSHMHQEGHTFIEDNSKFLIWTHDGFSAELRRLKNQISTKTKDATTCTLSTRFSSSHVTAIHFVDHVIRCLPLHSLMFLMKSLGWGRRNIKVSRFLVERTV